MMFVLVSYLFQVEPLISFGSYILGISTLKGILCKELRDVFNLRKIADIYKTTGLLDSIISAVSFSIMLSYYLSLSGQVFSVTELLVHMFPCIILYRFMFWNASTVLKKIYT